MQPVVIAVAITGSQPRKKDNPAVPITPAEQVEATQAAFEVGATIVHIHVRNDDETSSSSPERFAEVQEGVRKYCPGMIVQFSTGGRGRLASERGSSLMLAPDMASLATGSVNFTNYVYENPSPFVEELAQTMKQHDIKPEIEVFDAAMLYAASSLAKRGLIPRPLHVQFVLGIPNALPVRREVLEFLLSELKALEPDASWCAMGTGRRQLDVNRWSLELGGHARTGFEDNIRFDETRLARSNAELVARVAQLCGEYGRRPATAAEARGILHLRPA